MADDVERDGEQREVVLVAREEASARVAAAGLDGGELPTLGGVEGDGVQRDAPES